MGGAEKELSTDNVKGIALALLSSGFIGASFIIKKKGLRRAAVASGIRAGVGGYSYLIEPLWWVGMITMIVGEVANFVAYAFAPAVLVTPLGALSIIVSAVLAHFILNERLHALGLLGCVMCIAGSVVIVIHAPQEREITSVREIWNMATQPAFLLYVASVIVVVFVLVFHFSPLYGQSNVLIYTAICSLMGSLSVMSVKALGTSLKLTFEGTNQLVYPETWFFMLVVATCVLTQMNYLNKALDTFNTAIVSPIYYVMFTTLTILASVIMFKDMDDFDIPARRGQSRDKGKGKAHAAEPGRHSVSGRPGVIRIDDDMDDFDIPSRRGQSRDKGKGKGKAGEEFNAELARKGKWPRSTQ